MKKVYVCVMSGVCACACSRARVCVCVCVCVCAHVCMCVCVRAYIDDMDNFSLLSVLIVIYIITKK